MTSTNKPTAGGGVQFPSLGGQFSTSAASAVIPENRVVTDLDALMQHFGTKAVKELRFSMTRTQQFMTAIVDNGSLPIYELGQHVCSNVCVLVMEHYVKKMVAALTTKSSLQTARA